MKSSIMCQNLHGYLVEQVNPKAKVSVKLVAEAGIGTVASGVAKGNADIIQVYIVTCNPYIFELHL